MLTGIRPALYMLISPYIPLRNRVYIASFSVTSARSPIGRPCNQQKLPSPIAKVHIRAMSSNSSSPPPLSHILETCIYARDLSASVEFYKGIFNIQPFLETPRMSGFSLGQTTLLLFQIGSTHEDVHLQNGTIPGHGPTETIRHSLLTPSDTPMEEKPKLKQHFCLAVKNPEDVDRWDEHLRNKGVNVTARMKWERGGRSIYFEDPDGHVGEIASRGLWAHY